MTVPKINSAHGSDTRNIINRAIEVLNQQGISIQDLVAEGQLTDEQYAELITVINGLVKSGHIDKNDLTSDFKDEIEGFSAQLAQKTTKGEISLSDLNKNSVKYDATWFSDDFLADLSNNEINTTYLEDYAVTSKKIADNSVSEDKAEFVKKSTNLFNPKNAQIGYNINDTTGYLEPNNKFNVTDYFPIKEYAVYTVFRVAKIAFYDENKGHIGNVSALSIIPPENSAYARIVYEPFHVDVIQLNEGSELLPYEPYYLKIDGLEIDDEQIIGEIPSSKRTVLGESAVLMPSTPAKLPNIDLINGKIDIYGLSFLYYREERVSFDTDLEIPFYPQKISNQILTYNTKTNEFECSRGHTTEAWVTEDHVVIMHMAFTDDNQTELLSARAPFEFTVNGEPYFELRSENKKSKQEIIDSEEHVVLGLTDEEFFNSVELPARDLMNVGHSFIYNHFDSLLDEYGHLITKTVTGNDGFGNDINRYDVIPTGMVDVNGNPIEPNLPKIFWNVAIHGRERTTSWVAYHALKLMLENRSNNKTIENFLNNHHLIIVPVASPNGWDDRTRTNRNGVDLNRNQPSGWVQGTQGSQTYGGSHPLSEPESVIINNILKEDNLKFVIDFHNYGGSDKFIWLPSSSKQIRNIGYSFIQQMFTQYTKDYTELPKGIFGYTDDISDGGMVVREARANGVYGNTFEIAERFNLLSETINSEHVITMGVKAYINWNLMVAKNIAHIDGRIS